LISLWLLSALQAGIEEKAKTTNESYTQLPVPASSFGSRASVTRTTAALESLAAAVEQKRLISQLSSPFVRQDIFYTGSVISLREYKTSQDMATYVQVYCAALSLCAHLSLIAS